MFWHMNSLSSKSPVDMILDRKNFTLEDLLDEDTIITESKANWRLINFLHDRKQLKKLIQYIVEEAPADAERQRSFKFPSAACEILVCGTDIILKALVEDRGVMDQLFSFLDPERSHSAFLAGHFSKVVICLLTRMTAPIMDYIQLAMFVQPRRVDILKKLVDLIGNTSIMELLNRLLGADGHVYENHPMLWLEPDVLDMILDKFSSSDAPEVHDNAAEILCGVARCAPLKLGLKITSQSFMTKLLHLVFKDSRPKSVLVNLLSVCISLLNLDPERLKSGMSCMFYRPKNHVSGHRIRTSIVTMMLMSVGNSGGDLLKLLDYSSDENVLLTTYGKLEPPVGKDRLKVVEFITALAVNSQAARRKLVHMGVVKHIIKMFFDYPYNSFLHHHVENIILSFLESKNYMDVLRGCNLIEKILEAEINQLLAIETYKPTKAAEGKAQPRLGNLGHITRIANKIVQLGSSNTKISTLQQANSNWIYWQTNLLRNRNTVENVYGWKCGRPSDKKRSDHLRDSDDDDDLPGRKRDVPILADLSSQAFLCGAYNKNGTEETHGSLSSHEPVLSLGEHRCKSNLDRFNLAYASQVSSRKRPFEKLEEKLPLEKQDEMSPEGYNEDAYIDVEIPGEFRPFPIHPINNLNDEDHPDSISDIASLTWFDYKFLDELDDSASLASPDYDSADTSTAAQSLSLSGLDTDMVFEENPESIYDIGSLYWLFDEKPQDEWDDPTSSLYPNYDSADTSTAAPSSSLSGVDTDMVFEEQPNDIASEKKDDNEPVDYGSTDGRRCSLDFKEIDPATNMEEVD